MKRFCVQRLRSRLVFTLISLSLASPADTGILPPLVPWDGASRALPVPATDEWVTPSEASRFSTTPRYDETVAWLERLVSAAPELEMVSLGTSLEGREIWMVVASAAGEFDPARLNAAGTPRLLVHAGIHSGEIDGKDAGLMLLRDMTVRGTKAGLLDEVVLLFVPILSVDGHERFSRYSRVNQRGPEEAGWRTTRQNLNLNRDYAKLDTVELRALVAAVNEWEPDLYIDIHVTDGIDYQHDITFGFNHAHAWSPSIGAWLERRLTPAFMRDLEAQGHVPSLLIFANNDRDYSDGVLEWTAGPRFSTGYGDARHLPTVLVENHSLKPYEQRVLGTYVLMESAMRLLASETDSLRRAVAKDRTVRPDPLVLGWTAPDPPEAKPKTMPLKGIVSEQYLSPVTGTVAVRWTGVPVDVELPLTRQSAPKAVATRPEFYYIPATWATIANRLRLHGIAVKRSTVAETVEVDMYHLPDARLAAGANPYEGRARIDPGLPVVERRQLRLPGGSYRIRTDQPLGDLAMLLLEPQSPDSFLQWGFFLSVLNRTEYVEGYAMEPMARRMLAADPALEKAFRARLLEDEAFAGDPAERLMWFYRRTPYFDDEYRLYPVARSPTR